MKSHTSKQLYLVAAIVGICLTQQASATTIYDNYEGASSEKSDGTFCGDVIGSASNFQINYMDVSLSGNILSVSIDTTFDLTVKAMTVYLAVIRTQRRAAVAVSFMEIYS